MPIWKFISKSDPQWDCQGRITNEEVQTMYTLPQDAKDQLEILRERYGAVPDDLEYFFNKDDNEGG